MLIILDNMMRIYKAKESTLDEIRDELEFRNPSYGMAVARANLGRYVPEMPPKYLKLYHEHNDHLGIPIGTDRDLIKKIARKHGEKIKCVDRRSSGYTIQFEVPKVGYFRGYEEHQDKIIDTIEKENNSVSSCPTGGGKTIAALGAIERLQVSTIIIVDKKDLFQQWDEEIQALTTGTYTLGYLGCGVKKPGDVTIAMIQTLTKLKPKVQEEIMGKFGLVIVDEVHKAAAPTFVVGCNMFTAKKKHGLSATPFRKDSKEFIFKHYIGPIKLEVSDDEVMDTGRIVPMKYEFLDTGFSLDYSSIDHNIEMYPLVALSDYDRTRFIVNAVMRDLELGFVPLVVSDRIPHLKKIYNMLKTEGLMVGLIIGENTDHDRTRVRNQMKEGVLDVLVANQTIFGTGMNVPILSSIHVTSYLNNKALLKQLTGRVRRGFQGKKYGKIVVYRDDVYELELNKMTRELVRYQADTFKKTYGDILRFFRKWGFEKETERTIL